MISRNFTYVVINFHAFVLHKLMIYLHSKLFLFLDLYNAKAKISIKITEISVKTNIL
jgi:hypothetical protein